MKVRKQQNEIRRGAWPTGIGRSGCSSQRDGRSTYSTGRIFDIQRGSMHDGPGIRTTVFLKGCPLRCSWCHNPESQRFAPERMEASGRSGQFETVGRDRPVDEVLSLVLRDRDFFTASGGGVTVSGGEPMASFDFTKELLVRAKSEGLHTSLDTSGAAPVEQYREVAPWVDLFLWDVKLFEPVVARRHVGRDASELTAGLRAVDREGAASILRCPIIPGFNDVPSHFRAVADLANELAGVKEIHLIPYHSFGNQKRKRLGRTDSFDARVVSAGEVDEWRSLVKKFTAVSVGKG